MRLAHRGGGETERVGAAEATGTAASGPAVVQARVARAASGETDCQCAAGATWRPAKRASRCVRLAHRGGGETERVGAAEATGTAASGPAVVQARVARTASG